MRANAVKLVTNRPLIETEAGAATEIETETRSWTTSHVTPGLLRLLNREFRVRTNYQP